MMNIFASCNTYKAMLQILNPTRFVKYGITKRVLYVPEYDDVVQRNKRSQDLAMRYAEEITLYTTRGGLVVFATFTYADAWLPKLPIFHEDGSCSWQPCFSRSHKDTFLDSLRHYLYRNFPAFKKQMSGQYTLDAESLPFRYVWASELGSDGTYVDDHGNVRQATNRPHYHVLFFFPVTIVRSLGTDPASYKKLISQFWHYGMIRWSDEKRVNPYPIFVTNEFAARYVSAYCNKQLNFYSDPDVKKIVYDKNGKLRKDLPDDIKDLLPFHKTSNHVGESLKEKFVSFQDIKDGIDLEYQVDKEHGVNKRYRPPQYIFRKLFMYYDRDETRYKYTPNGVAVAVELFKDRLSDYVQKFGRRYNPRSLQKKLEGVEIDSIFADISAKNVFDIQRHITSILVDNDKIREFFLYLQVFAGRTIQRCPNRWKIDLFDDSTYTLFKTVDNNLSWLSHDEFCHAALEMYKEQFIYDLDYYDKIDDKGVFSFNDPPEHLYDDCRRFSGFFNLQKLLQRIDDIYAQRITKKYNDIIAESKLHKLEAI